MQFFGSKMKEQLRRQKRKMRATDLINTLKTKHIPILEIRRILCRAWLIADKDIKYKGSPQQKADKLEQQKFLKVSQGETINIHLP